MNRHVWRSNQMKVRKTSSESRWPVLLLVCMLSTQALCADQHQISITDLQNSSYTGIEAVPVRLKDGHWQGQPYVEDGASRPTVGLLKEFYLNGDLDGDDIIDSTQNFYNMLLFISRKSSKFSNPILLQTGTVILF